MKKWLLHIMLVGVLGMLAASCSQDADDPTQESRKTQVVFTISLDNQSASRGTWGDNFDDDTTNDYSSAIGTSPDNYINPDQFYVRINDCEVNNIMYWQTETKNVYEFIGDVEVDPSLTDAKIMVYANMSPNSEGSFDNVAFSQNAAYIPMFGMQTLNLSLTSGSRIKLDEPIYMLRAMAKVEVELAENMKDKYTLTNVSLNRYNSQGYCLPAGITDVDNTKELFYANDPNKTDEPFCFRPLVNGSNNTALSLSVTESHLVYYLPEVANGAGANGDLTMTLTITDNENNTFILNGAAPVLYFKDYRTNIPFDVVRNHWYKYTVSIYNNAEFNVSYKAEDWVDIEPGTLNFGDENGATLIPNNSNQ